MSLLNIGFLKKLSTRRKEVFVGQSLVTGSQFSPDVELNSNNIAISYKFTSPPSLPATVRIQNKNDGGYNNEIEIGEIPAGEAQGVIYATTNTTKFRIRLILGSGDSATSESFVINELAVSKSVEDNIIKLATNKTNVTVYQDTPLVSGSVSTFSSDIEMISNRVNIACEFKTALSSDLDVYTQSKNANGYVDEKFIGTIKSGTTEVVIPAKLSSTIFRFKLDVDASDDGKVIDSFVVSVNETDSVYKNKIQKVADRAIIADSANFPDPYGQITLNDVYKYLNIKNKSNHNPLRIKLNGFSYDLNPKAERSMKLLNGVENNLIQHQAHIGGVDFDLIASEEEIFTGNSFGVDQKFRYKNIASVRIFSRVPGETDVFYGVRSSDLKTLVKIDASSDELWINETHTPSEISITDVETFVNNIADVWITESDTILVFLGEDRGSSINEGVKRSTDSGVTWTDVSVSNRYNHLSMSGIQEADGAIIFVEYTIETGFPINIYKSSDDGASFTSVHSYNATRPVRHYHRVQPDRYETQNGIWYVTTGDDGDEIRWLKSVDGGNTFTEIAEITGKNHVYKDAGFFITPDHIVWGGDGEGKRDAIYKAPKDNLVGGRKAKFMNYGLVWVHGQLGNALIASTTKPTNHNDRRFNPNVQRLMYSEDLGETWNIITEWRGDSQSVTGFKTMTQPNDYEQAVFNLFTSGLEGHYSDYNALIISLNN